MFAASVRSATSALLYAHELGLLDVSGLVRQPRHLVDVLLGRTFAVPKEAGELLLRLLARLVDDLNARGEDVAVQRDAYEGQIQDYLIKNRNLAPEQARRIASALSGRREKEGGDPASNLGIQIDSGSIKSGHQESRKY